MADDNVTVVKAQPVAAVYDAAEKHLTIREDWQALPAAICPLPDLNGDGRMWVVDFRLITTVDRSYLPTDRRVRCLSELGWALFRQRYIVAVTRGELPIEDLTETGRAAWIESEMETRWAQVRGADDRPAFHTWLSAPDTVTGYVSRRRAIEACEAESVWHQLRDELGE